MVEKVIIVLCMLWEDGGMVSPVVASVVVSLFTWLCVWVLCAWLICDCGCLLCAYLLFDYGWLSYAAMYLTQVPSRIFTLCIKILGKVGYLCNICVSVQQQYRIFKFWLLFDHRLVHSLAQNWTGTFTCTKGASTIDIIDDCHHLSPWCHHLSIKEPLWGPVWKAHWR